MNIIERLLADGPAVTDGAWGTQLQARGLESGECPDTWNLTHADRVEEVARAYVEAGSQVILTNTFRANRIAMEAVELPGTLEEINRAGVAISRRAAGDLAAVFASIGPSGKLLPAGEVDPDKLYESFSEQARWLAEAGADVLLIETMSDLEEARIALAAALPTKKPVAVSMVFDAGRRKDRTMMGNTPEQCARELMEAGAAVVGANCGCGVEGYVEIARRMHAAASVPIWIKANAGLPELVEGKAVWRMEPQVFAGYVPALLEAGARFIGGCCGTGPEFIRAMKGRIAACASS
jgi:methionine synthase I (cobalamin-dependent)